MKDHHNKSRSEQGNTNLLKMVNLDFVPRSIQKKWKKLKLRFNKSMKIQQAKWLHLNVREIKQLPLEMLSLGPLIDQESLIEVL